WLAVLGPSGAGKTTLLRAIAGLEAPDSGRVRLDGRDAASIPARERGVGFVFQDLALWPYLTVAGHLEEITSRPGPLLERFGLKGLEGKRPAQLSGRERGMTVIYVSHYFEAPVIRASRVALLRDGQLEQAGTLSDLRSNPRNDWVAAFVADEERIES